MSMNQPDDRHHLPSVMDNNSGAAGSFGESPNKGFAMSGKIMLTAIVVLILVLILMASLHLYARWYLLRERRRQLLLRRNRRRNSGNRRAHIVFYVDSDNPNALVTLAGGVHNNHPANKGLEPAVISSLPVFAYSSKTHPDGLECAVCLSEFEEEEKGRILPKCNHSFHTECIDMWFHSHSTCPICRAVVEPVQKQDNRMNSVSESVDSNSSSGLCEACQHQEDAVTGSSGSSISSSSGGSSLPPPLGSRRKGLHLSDVRIEVPMRGTTQLDDELPVSSPAGYGVRSPGARLLSLKRILSMGRKTPTGSSSSAGTSCSPQAAEPDLEKGITPAESTRVPTPR